MINCNIKFSDTIKCNVLYLDKYEYKENYIYGIFERCNISKRKNNEKIYKTDSSGIEFRCLQKEENFVDVKLLTSLIRLHQQLPELIIDYNNVLNVSIPEIEKVERQIINHKKYKKYINLILKWCQKYGMPFVGDIYENSYFNIVQNGSQSHYDIYGFKNDYNYTIEESELDVYKFRLGCFLIGLDIIYKTFILAISLNKDKFLYSTKTDYEHEYFYKLDISKYEYLSIEEKYNIINDFINSMHIFVKSQYQSNNKLDYSLFGETLFSTVMYQLLLFISFENNNVGICLECKNVFIKYRTNHLFCSNACRQANHRSLLNKQKDNT